MTLEQRLRAQLLLLMYKKNKDIIMYLLGILEKVGVLYLRLIDMKELCINVVHILLILNCGIS